MLAAKEEAPLRGPHSLKSSGATIGLVLAGSSSAEHDGFSIVYSSFRGAGAGPF
jgi:hypothetical protein